MAERSSSFRATESEFRSRFWIIGGVFWLGFALYAADRVNFAAFAARWLAGPGSHHMTGFARAILGLGTALAVMGSLVRSWGTAYLHSSVVHDASIHSERLTADGPYRYVRNPLYLGIVLLALGLGTMASRLGFLVIVLGVPIIVYRLILREEAGLLATQGDSYRAYFRAVPRLIPSLIPRVPVGQARPDWVDGFAGEAFTWGMSLGMAAFTVTLRLPYWYAGLAAGFGVYAVQAFRRSARRRAAESAGAAR
jgi:protein-S-isoprenylcysteine O-methyltransferase Ste14